MFCLQTKSSAFTIIEISVVVGLVCLLLAILLPALASVRSLAHQAQCAANLRQWGQALFAYAGANDMWLPYRGQGKNPTQTISNPDDWFNNLPPYLSLPSYQQSVNAGHLPAIGDGTVWNCPAASAAPNAYGNLFTYAMNMALSPRSAPQPDNYMKVGPPGTMVFLADSPGPYCSTIPFLSTPAAPALFNPSPRHNGKVNIAFLDGHVEALDAAYIGCNVGDPKHQDVRWYWYVPGPFPAPWSGP